VCGEESKYDGKLNCDRNTEVNIVPADAGETQITQQCAEKIKYYWHTR
jgi:hypothetical protein